MTQQIWTGLLESDRVARYYSMLANKLRWRHNILTATLIVLATGAAASLLAQLPAWVSAGVIFLTACISAWLYVFDYSGKATAASLFSDQYGRLHTKWTQLWYAENPTIEEIRALQDEYNNIAIGFTLDTDEALNDKAQEEAYTSVPNQFGHSERGAATTAS